MAQASPTAVYTAEPKETLVKINQVSKTFDTTWAVDEVSLEIKRGEIFALLGASGSGKSTLLRMLAGFERPTQGTIFLDGDDITNVPPHKRAINMMFQSYALFPHMTIEQNIAFGLKQDNMPKDEIAERVAKMLKLVHMHQYARRKPDQLSGGQRQRVALARSLAKQPKLLLLDEPMGALDKKLRTEMQLEVVDILEKVGATCVMVTHDQEEAMTMAYRMAIMDLGKIVQIGTPRDIYESPNCRNTAEFIGSINIFEGSIVDDKESQLTIQSPDLDTPILVGHGVSTSVEAKDLMYAIRPEKTLLSTGRPSQHNNWSEGIVEDIAYLGGHSIFYVKLNRTGKIVQCFLANTERRYDAPVWNDRVYVSWDEFAGVVLNS